MKKKYITIRELKRGLSNFAYDSETGDRKSLLLQKMTIINKNIFGDDTDDWLSPKEILRYLEDIVRDTADKTVGAVAQHLVEVVSYLMGESNERPESIAVAKASEFLSSNGGREYADTDDVADALFDAIEYGDTEKALMLIQFGVDPNARQGCLTLFMCAALNCNIPVAQALLDAGADINATEPHEYHRDSLGLVLQNYNTSFSDACKEMALFLIKNGADVSHEDDNNSFPLARAASANSFNNRNPDTTLMEALINAGADVNQATKTGWTALMEAAYAGYTGGVKFLLEHGADPSMKDKKGWTARRASMHARLDEEHPGEIIALLNQALKEQRRRKKGMM